MHHFVHQIDSPPEQQAQYFSFSPDNSSVPYSSHQPIDDLPLSQSFPAVPGSFSSPGLEENAVNTHPLSTADNPDAIALNGFTVCSNQLFLN